MNTDPSASLPTTSINQSINPLKEKREYEKVRENMDRYMLEKSWKISTSSELVYVVSSPCLNKQPISQASFFPISLFNCTWKNKIKIATLNWDTNMWLLSFNHISFLQYQILPSLGLKTLHYHHPSNSSFCCLPLPTSGLLPQKPYPMSQLLSNNFS